MFVSQKETCKYSVKIQCCIGRALLASQRVVVCVGAILECMHWQIYFSRVIWHVIFENLPFIHVGIL